MNDTNNQEIEPEITTTNFIRGWHLAIVLICLAAWLTGDMAHDYKKPVQSGFIIHGVMGMVFIFALSLYFGYGIIGPRALRFSQWFPLTAQRLRQTKADLTDLSRATLPTHKRRKGLAGMVQFIGLLVFCWLSTTGLLLYFFIEPGTKTRGILHGIQETHEIAGILIPLFLLVHIGAVIAHSISGTPVWRDIFFCKKD